MIIKRKCKICNKMTLHQETTVYDGESATVFHCLECGHEERPDGGNSFVRIPLKPNDPDEHSILPNGGNFKEVDFKDINIYEEEKSFEFTRSN